MHSLRGWEWLVFGDKLELVHSVVLPPAITPAPRPAQVDFQSLQNRQDPNAIEVLQALLTALPFSLRQIAATNIPAVSSIIWQQFLDNNRPDWFDDLPYDVQSYFIAEFGPATAAAPTSEALPTDVSATATELPMQTDSSTSNSVSSSAVESLILSRSESMRTSSTPTVSSILKSTSSAIADPVAPAPSDPRLSRSEKMGIGIGVPLALLVTAALLFACCTLFRHRRRRHIEGNEPPSSPGFIPRFSFQDHSLGSENFEHRAPLNPSTQQSSRFVEDMNWEDDGYAPAMSYQRHTLPPPAVPMAMQDRYQPILAPTLKHTHSSNRARGRRTSYASLHAFAEATEPDDEMTDSPILGRPYSPPRIGFQRPNISTIDMLPLPAVASIKRKPVPTSPITSPAAKASRGLLRPTLTHNVADHSGSSSSGLAVSSMSSDSGHVYGSASISPIGNQASTNPSAGGYSYIEDYGPEYSSSGYTDQDDELYGGNRSLDRYPEPSPPRKTSKTEWPLLNVVGMREKRNRSSMWDRVYERV